MTLCPLQFPWDTVPLLPPSPERRGTRLASQNRFFSSTKKIWVETLLAELARAGSRRGARRESLGKEELCISLAAFLCRQGTRRKFFSGAKTHLPEKPPLSSRSSPSHPPLLPSRPETSECHFHAVTPTSGTAEPAPFPPALLVPLGLGCCPGARLRLRARAAIPARRPFHQSC